MGDEGECGYGRSFCKLMDSKTRMSGVRTHTESSLDMNSEGGVASVSISRKGAWILCLLADVKGVWPLRR